MTAVKTHSSLVNIYMYKYLMHHNREAVNFVGTLLWKIEDEIFCLLFSVIHFVVVELLDMRNSHRLRWMFEKETFKLLFCECRGVHEWKLVLIRCKA